MKLIAITPIKVTEAELARRQKRYQRIAPEGLEIELLNLAMPTAPTSLDQESDIRKSDLGVSESLHALPSDEFDFAMPDCVLDPGYRQGGSNQVLGMLEKVVSDLAAKGESIGAVTRNAPIGEELIRRIKEYGYGNNFAGLAVLQLSFDAIDDEVLWHKALEIAVDELAQKGATVVINGCSAVNVNQGSLKLPVIDPAAYALNLLVADKTK